MLFWENHPGDVARTIAKVDAWAASEAMAALVQAFGGLIEHRRGALLLDYLDGFSGSHWDFRGGRERNLATLVPLSARREALVFDSAAELGLAGIHVPRRQNYDAIVMTGGMVRAGVVKPRFARELLDAGIGAKDVAFLGGFRPFAGDEIELALALGVEGTNEFDAMAHGMLAAFGPLGTPEVGEELVENPSGSWREWSWETAMARLSVVAAPSSAPEKRRANTADTYRFWAERNPTLRSVLVVTTPIYVPYQGAAAVEILGVEYGISVETVGISTAANDLGAVSQPFLAQNHLQEIRSAIRGMRSLRRKLVKGDLHGGQ